MEETVQIQKRKIRDIKTIKCESDYDLSIYKPMNFFKKGRSTFRSVIVNNLT